VHAASIIRVMIISPLKCFWNVGELLPDYTAQYPRKQSFYARRRENLTSHVFILRNDLYILYSFAVRVRKEAVCSRLASLLCSHFVDFFQRAHGGLLCPHEWRGYGFHTCWTLQFKSSGTFLLDGLCLELDHFMTPSGVVYPFPRGRWITWCVYEHGTEWSDK
jgi:hypothetical protein